MAQNEYQDINEIRRRALRLKVEELGLDEVCDKLKIHRNQMRHWIGRNYTRAISDESARKIERVLKLPPNWMDNAHPEQVSTIERMMELPQQEFFRGMTDRAVQIGVQAALEGIAQGDRVKLQALEDRIANLERLMASLSSSQRRRQQQGGENDNGPDDPPMSPDVDDPPEETTR